MEVSQERLEEILDAWRRSGEAIRAFGSTVEEVAIAMQATINAYREAAKAGEEE